MRDVSLKLPDTLIQRLQKMARDRDVTVGQLIREAIARDLNDDTPPEAPKPVAQSKPVTLGDAFVAATGWHDLIRRLRDLGVFVTESGGDLLVRALSDQSTICRSSDLGHRYMDLRKRFQSPLPNPHPVEETERVFSTVRAPRPELAQNGTRM